MCSEAVMDAIILMIFMSWIRRVCIGEVYKISKGEDHHQELIIAQV